MRSEYPRSALTASVGRKKDAVYDFVLERLVDGQFRFGERISTSLIADATGASRQPIMSALQTLRSQGFVRIIAQVGCEVISPTLREIEDFYLLLGRIEGVLAELAASRGSREEVDELRRVNALIEKLPRNRPDSGLKYRALNREFHGIYHAMARSPKLHEEQVVNWAMSDFLIIQTYGFLPHLRGAAEEHEQIIQALAQGGRDAARSAAEQHINSVSHLVTSNIRGGAPAAPKPVKKPRLSSRNSLRAL